MRRGTVRTFQTEEMRASCDRPSQIGLVKVGLYGVLDGSSGCVAQHNARYVRPNLICILFGLKSASFVTIQCLDEILKKRGGGGPCSCR